MQKNCDELKQLVLNKNIEKIRNYILERQDFKYTFTANNFYKDIRNWMKIKNQIVKIEIQNKMYTNYRQSIIYKLQINILDANYDVRKHYNYKCQICNLDMKNNKDILDVHYKSSKNKRFHIIEKSNLLVCCRLCHFNIDPKTHWNLDISQKILNRILKLRKQHKK